MKKLHSPATSQTQSKENKGQVAQNPWQALRKYTDARIALGRAGISLPTSEMLAFQLSHAQARDAVNFPLDVKQLFLYRVKQGTGALTCNGLIWGVD